MIDLPFSIILQVNLLFMSSPSASYLDPLGPPLAQYLPPANGPHSNSGWDGRFRQPQPPLGAGIKPELQP